jgi:Bacteriophage probable baseplate hub protein
MSYIAPNRVVKIEGKEIAEDVSADIVSVSFEDHATDVDMATIVVNNKDGKWVDSGLFDKGRTVEISLGYGHAPKRMFKGRIVRPELSFPEDGVPTLTVRAYDLSYQMRRSEEKTNTTWQNITDSQLARKIASKYGFKAKHLVMDDTRDIIPYIAQGNLTDWEFLKERVERIGFELYVELDEFHFHRPRDYVKRIPGMYEYRRNLRSFEPRLTTAEQVSKVVVKGWDEKRKAPIVAIATSETTLERPVLGKQAGSDFVKEDFGEGAKILHDRAPASQKEAEEIAKAYFRQKEYGLIEAHGTCIGEPELRAKGLIEIKGVGRKFSGTYYVTRVAHTLDEHGYLCEFDCKRNAIEG